LFCREDENYGYTFAEQMRHLCYEIVMHKNPYFLRRLFGKDCTKKPSAKSAHCSLVAAAEYFKAMKIWFIDEQDGFLTTKIKDLQLEEPQNAKHPADKLMFRLVAEHDLVLDVNPACVGFSNQERSPTISELQTIFTKIVTARDPNAVHAWDSWLQKTPRKEVDYGVEVTEFGDLKSEDLLQNMNMMLQENSSKGGLAIHSRNPAAAALAFARANAEVTGQSVQQLQHYFLQHQVNVRKISP
jgi:hypothetical protein